MHTTETRPGDQQWRVSRDLVGYESALEVVKDGGTERLDAIDLEVGRRVYQRYSWVADDFTSARGEVVSTMTFHRGDWDVRAVTRTVLTCTSDKFHLHAQLDGYEHDRRVHSQNWNLTIPRDHL